MKKSELIVRLGTKSPRLAPKAVECAVTVILDTIAAALAEGGRAELRRFGTFSVRSRHARVGRNPRTGESVMVRGKQIPFFKASKELRKRVQPSRV